MISPKSNTEKRMQYFCLMVEVTNRIQFIAYLMGIGIKNRKLSKEFDKWNGRRFRLLEYRKNSDCFLNN